MLKAKLVRKEEQLSSLQTKVKTLESRLESQEQYSRRNCLRISGIGEQEGENVIEKTLDLFNSKMKVSPPVDLSEVDRIHRLGKPTNKKDKPRGIIVKFATYRSRERVMELRRSLKSLETGAPNSNPRIYLNDCLTQQRAELMFKLRMMKKKRQINGCWTHDGNRRKLKS